MTDYKNLKVVNIIIHTSHSHQESRNNSVMNREISMQKPYSCGRVATLVPHIWKAILSAQTSIKHPAWCIKRLKSSIIEHKNKIPLLCVYALVNNAIVNSASNRENVVCSNFNNWVTIEIYRSSNES